MFDNLKLNSLHPQYSIVPCKLSIVVITPTFFKLFTIAEIRTSFELSHNNLGYPSDQTVTQVLNRCNISHLNKKIFSNLFFMLLKENSQISNSSNISYTTPLELVHSDL